MTSRKTLTIKKNSEHGSKVVNVKPKIINISSYVLNDTEIQLLSKGSKFCPTPQYPDLLDLEVDLNEFARSLLLQELFANKTNNSSQGSLVKKKGEFIPNDSNNFDLNSVVKKLKKVGASLNNIPKNEVNFNITLSERKALKTLQANKNIVIRESDKGSALVVMNANFYKNTVEGCLNNSNLYKNWGNENPDRKIIANLEKMLSEHSNCLTEEERHYISKFDYKSANFFANPKIHKSDSIKNAISRQNKSYIEIPEVQDLPFRYIAGGKNAPISKLAELVEKLLKPYYSVIPSYIKDGTDFLNKLPKLNKEEVKDILIVTCDIKDMYNNINRDLGIEALTFWLNKYPHLLHERFNSSFIIESIQFILENWCFHFNGNYFSLSQGTVTGTAVSPIYASLTIAFLELQMYSKIKETFGDEVQDYVIKNWKRFLDDGQILWKKSFGDISNFVNILNNLHRDISFTYEASDEKLSFLNIMLYIENDNLLTDIYYKPTDCHDYLPYNSCHPKHVTRNIPYTLARMIATIVDDPQRKSHRLSELKTWLKQSKYPIELINDAILKFENVDSYVLREPRSNDLEMDENNKIIFVTTHNPQNPDVWSIVKNAFDFLKTSPNLKRVFGNLQLIKSERQTKNLGRLLQNSYFSESTAMPGTTKCNRPKCGTCPYILETDSVYFNDANVHFKIRNNFSCDSGYLIYFVNCRHCDKYYIGQTTNLRNRVTSHKFNIRNEAYRNTKFYKHIYECAGANKISFNITPFYHCTRNTNTAMLTIENYFIRLGKPPLNS